MKTILRQYTVQELCKGFMYNQMEEKGLFGLSGATISMQMGKEMWLL